MPGPQETGSQGEPSGAQGRKTASGHDHDHAHGPHHDHGHDGYQHHPPPEAAPHLHSHGHDHSHDILHVPHASVGKLRLAFWVITLFMAVEVVCGWFFNSLTLISDGFHMLSDAVALGVAGFAISL